LFLQLLQTLLLLLLLQSLLFGALFGDTLPLEHFLFEFVGLDLPLALGLVGLNTIVVKSFQFLACDGGSQDNLRKEE